MAAYASRPDIVVLANTPEVQAAKKPSLGVVAANFWTGGTHSIGLITADAPSSVITCGNPAGFAVGISDPTQTNTGSITVTLDQAASALVGADPGVTVEQLSPRIIVHVDLKGSLGKTFQASFRVSP
jgi:hyaluronate lyase